MNKNTDKNTIIITEFEEHCELMMKNYGFRVIGSLEEQYVHLKDILDYFGLEFEDFMRINGKCVSIIDGNHVIDMNSKG